QHCEEAGVGLCKWQQGELAAAGEAKHTHRQDLEPRPVGTCGKRAKQRANRNDRKRSRDHAIKRAMQRTGLQHSGTPTAYSGDALHSTSAVPPIVARFVFILKPSLIVLRVDRVVCLDEALRECVHVLARRASRDTLWHAKRRISTASTAQTSLERGTWKVLNDRAGFAVQLRRSICSHRAGDIP